MKSHNKSKIIIALLFLLPSLVFFNNKELVLAKSHHSIEQKHSQRDFSKINDVAYGSGLTDNLLDKTKSIFNKNEKSERTVFVEGSDVNKYLETDGGPSDDDLLSSVWVKSLPKGSGVVVNILNPEKITSINKMQYENIIITAGVSDVEVDVASPVENTGEYSMIGLYKILEKRGVQIDKDRTQLAQDELYTMRNIDQENNVDNDYNPNDLCEVFLNIKKEFAEDENINNEKYFTREEIKDLVDNKLKKEGLNVILSDNNVDLIVDYFERYQYSDAVNSKNVLNNLNKLSNNISKRAREYEDKNENDIEEKPNNSFFNKVIFFFKRLFTNKKPNFDNNVA